MAKRIYPSQETLKSLFDFDGKSGNLIRKTAVSNKKAGDIAGYLAKDGYRVIRVGGILYGCHRLVWIYHHGDIADGFQIDHENGNPSDNRIQNLRLATCLDNMRNRKIQKNNISGFKGVTHNPAWSKSNPWQARIRVNKKLICLGSFSTPEDAHEAYKKAAINFFGEFAKF